MRDIKSYSDFKLQQIKVIMISIILLSFLVLLTHVVIILDVGLFSFFTITSMMIPFLKIVIAIMSFNEKSYYEYVIETKEENEKFIELKNKAKL